MSDNTQMKPIAYILIGLPASGKSTWAKPMLESGEYVLISLDYHVEEYAKSIGKTYNDIFREYASTAEKQSKAVLKDAIENKKNVIWDQTNVSAKSRLKICQLKAYKKIAVVFQLPEDVHKERLAAREISEGKSIPEFILNSMRENFEFPTLDEGFDEIIEITYD